MFTRRTLLKRGGCALAVAAIPLVRTARAQVSGSFNYYIGPSGSDSNPGTQSSPWSINAINTKRSVYAGKSIGILPGTYNIFSIWGANGSNSWDAPALAIEGGTAGSPTLIQATVPRQAIITAANPSGGGYPAIESIAIGQGAASSGLTQLGNIIIDGLYITRCFQQGIGFYYSGPSGVGGGAGTEGGYTGIEIRNCEIYDVGGNDNDNVAGIFFQGVTGAWVHNNKIHSVQPATNGENAGNVAGIYSYYSHSNIYEYNTIYDCNQGIRDKYTPNGNHTYRYNYIEINGANPVAAIGDGNGGKPGDVLTINNNVFNVIGGSAGIWTGDLWSNNGSLNGGYTFINNTCIFPGGGSGGFFPAGGHNVSPNAMLTHYNNVYLYSGRPSYEGVITVIAGNIALSDYNLWGAGAAGGAYLTSAPFSNPGVPNNNYTLAQWQSAWGCDAHSAAASPSFTSPTSLNPAGFALVSASAGSAGGSHPGSTNGTPSGSQCDMGAWGGANAPSQIGCNFGPVPNAPVIISVT
jgi:hypothetical protein